MNLLTLVSSLVLVASTATAGILAAPPLLGTTAADENHGPGIAIGGWCIGSCGNQTGGQDNSTHGNQTSPLPPPLGGHQGPSGNHTRNQTSPPPATNQTAPPPTCGVEIHDSRDIEGPTRILWTWMVGTATTNLTVDLNVDGTWVPMGGGARVLLTDGDGDVVASSSSSGYALPFDHTSIRYSATAEEGLAYGEWHLTVEANGLLGGAYLDVHSAC
ncbi:MAG TPA: hypothetical protein VM286_09085 [Candidatus Thermoplasmatota archaeon]|nr:hypothetical protein [Candidatus Thermoplasmatota archaeon]